ncbi:sulfurtransferase [Duganella rhizosphaerae]|uniref:sulfurtransferase n=1 Tax=Duganella rhizosphaerae TaxID=2885763 RepID=UPI00403F552C
MIATDIATDFRPDLVRWRQLVTPAWLAALTAGATVEAAPSADWRLFDVGCGGGALFEQAHIPGAAYLDTSEIEQEPLWNKVSDQALLALLLARGVRHDTTVILYGRNNLAAARLAHLLLYAGVADVRLLDGGYARWLAGGHPCARGPAPACAAVPDFGIAFPVHPEYLCGAPQVRALLARGHDVLASIRTEAEFLGKESGYSYIAVGDIPGARWGRAGGDGDVNSMSAYHHADGSLKPAADIVAQWAEHGIVRQARTVFYCGTGWRASMAFFYAWLMGWPEICVYDGGWLEWSRL